MRDPAKGTSRGFGFIKYEDQRSTVLAVDNLNGVKILDRTLSCDHVKQYKLPKHVREREEKLAEEGIEHQRGTAGHAYEGFQDIHGKHDIKKGVDLFKAPGGSSSSSSSDDEDGEDGGGGLDPEGAKRRRKDEKKAKKKALKKELKKKLKKEQKKESKKKARLTCVDEDGMMNDDEPNKKDQKASLTLTLTLALTLTLTLALILNLNRL